MSKLCDIQKNTKLHKTVCSLFSNKNENKTVINAIGVQLKPDNIYKQNISVYCFVKITLKSPYLYTAIIVKDNIIINVKDNINNCTQINFDK